MDLRLFYRHGKPLSDRQACLQWLMQSTWLSDTETLLSTLGLKPKVLIKQLKALNSQHAADEAVTTWPKAGCKTPAEFLAAMRQSPDVALQALWQSHLAVTPQALAFAAQHQKRTWLVRSALSFGKELVEVFLTVMVALIITREGLGELRLIPSESMEPTLQIGDRVVIEKVSHWSRPYQHGDVLVFYPPNTQLRYDALSVLIRATGLSSVMYQKEDNVDLAYIKRLVGVPGDSIEVKQGQVWRNGVPVKEAYVPEPFDSCTFVQPMAICGPVTVPEGYFYMMGDNRNHSADSRYWGFAPQRQVIGRAVARAWPLNRLGWL